MKSTITHSCHLSENDLCASCRYFLKESTYPYQFYFHQFCPNFAPHLDPYNYLHYLTLHYHYCQPCLSKGRPLREKHSMYEKSFCFKFTFSSNVFYRGEHLLIRLEIKQISCQILVQEMHTLIVNTFNCLNNSSN